MFKTKTPKLLRRLWLWQPLSIRGWIALVLSIVALVFFAIPGNDLVAYILGGGTLALLSVCFLFSLFARIKLGKNLEAKLSFDATNPRSNKSLFSSINLSNCNLWPWLNLRLFRIFKEGNPQHSIHELTGSSNSDSSRVLYDQIDFPHRGNWETKALNLRIGDVFGFTRFLWEKPTTSSIEVSAPEISIRPIPVVAASSRSGDQVNQAKERSGDLFDIKRYSPSDGTKRIMWKTYARSRQLVVRRPEPAILPDGEVAIYLIADREDDHVAGSLLNYLKQLEDGNIEVIFGTDGAPNGKVLAFDFDEIKSSINRSVWADTAGSGNDFGNFISALAETKRAVSQVVVFGPQEECALWSDKVAELAGNNNINIVFTLVPKELAQLKEQKTNSSANVISNLVGTLKNQFMEKDTKQAKPDQKNYPKATLGGETIICEAGF